MNEREKALLILKSKFPENVDLHSMINVILQLKKPEVLLSVEENELFHKYAKEWSDKGLIVYVPPKQPSQLKYLEDGGC